MGLWCSHTHTNCDKSLHMIFGVRYAFLKVICLQLPNERVSFGAPSYVRRGHVLILTSHFPNPLQSELKCCLSYSKVETWRRKGLYSRSSAAGLPPSYPRRTAAEAPEVVQLPEYTRRSSRKASAAVQLPQLRRRELGRSPEAQLPGCKPQRIGGFLSPNSAQPWPRYPPL